ncbi:MAG: hypothetical protein ABEJ86_06035 [Halococcoides sp.]
MAESSPSSHRGQQSLLGVVFILAIVLGIVFVVVAAGSAVVDSAQKDLTMETAELSMHEFDDTINSLDGKQRSTGALSFDALSRKGSVSIAETGTLEFHMSNSSGSGPIVNRTMTLGKLSYRVDGREIAYQGGGIWRKDRSGTTSAMVSPPPVQIEDTSPVTIRIAAPTIRGTTVSRRISIRESTTTGAYPGNGTVPLSNNVTVRIGVESEYYRAWGRHFEAQPLGSVTYNHSRERAVLTIKNFSTPSAGSPASSRYSILGPISSSASVLEDSNDAIVESFTITPSGTTTTTRGDIYASGWYKGSNNMDVYGNVNAQGRAVVVGKPIHGYVRAGGNPTDASYSKLRADIGGDFSTTDDLKLVGAYSDTARIDGDLYVGGDLLKIMNTQIDGDVHVQGDLEYVGDDVDVNGSIIVGGTINGSADANDDIDGGIVSGTPNSPLTVKKDDPKNVIDLIDRKQQSIRTNNDNATMQYAIHDIKAYDACSPCHLKSGRYYFPDGFILNNKLTLDTSKGPIEIYAGKAPGRKSLKIRGGQIQVKGDHPVYLYTHGNATFVKGATVETKPQPYRAGRFRLYTVPSAKVKFATSGHFTGVVYGPGDPGTNLVLTNDQVIYGALVGRLDAVDSRAELHYPETLESARPRGATMKVEEQAPYVAIRQQNITVSG